VLLDCLDEPGADELGPGGEPAALLTPQIKALQDPAADPRGFFEQPAQLAEIEAASGDCCP